MEVHHDREHVRDCADCLTKSGSIHRFRVTIKLKGDLSDEQRERLLMIAGRCPVARTLGSKIRIDEVLA